MYTWSNGWDCHSTTYSSSVFIKACRHIGIKQLFKCGTDLSCSHLLDIQEKDFIIHTRWPSLLLFNQLRLEGPLSITWHIDLNRPVVSINGLIGMTVAAVGAYANLVFIIT